MVKIPNYTKYLVVGPTPEEIIDSLKKIINQYERDILFSNSFYGIITIIHAIEFWLKVMPLAMILISYVIIIITFNLISKDTETILMNQLNGVFEEGN
ncbi:hypothetical protein [Algoriphagus sp. Y33]|uniref:hypothetical protein n=1 Tax=Algoriphagus sp. Y33 TaxID=2772483 RepID=UPI001785DF94|nr:hypothetical protein [Algoriphagus sp. Y33]